MVRSNVDHIYLSLSKYYSMAQGFLVRSLVEAISRGDQTQEYKNGAIFIELNKNGRVTKTKLVKVANAQVAYSTNYND